MFKVFMVDDEPFIIEGLHHIVDWQEFGLEIAGYAYDGRQALDKMLDLKVDVLITDIAMPEMNGLELIRELRAIRPELKIIVLSGYNEFDYLKESMKYGIENYLLKPINVQELKETLRFTVDKLNAPAERLWSDNDINILRENVLYRWVAGRISPAELKERTALLKLDIAAPYYMAAVIRCPEREEEAHHAVAEAMDAGNATVFRDNEGNTVVLFALADQEEAREKARVEVETLRRKLIPYKLRITVGRAQASACGAAESYAQARKAQEYFIVRPEEETIDCERIEEEGGEVSGATAFSWPDYLKMLHAGDAAQLARRIAEDIRRMRDEPGMSPSALRYAVIGLLQQIHAELKSDPPFLQLDEIERIGRVTDIGELIAIVQEAAERLVAGLNRDGKSPVISGVLEYIHTAYSEPLSLKQLGRKFHVHPVYLGQLFQKETGIGFTDYLNRYRISKAKQLLRESHHKVHEIARLVGYREVGYFYRNFKKYTGLSPLDYKELSWRSSSGAENLT